MRALTRQSRQDLSLARGMEERNLRSHRVLPLQWTQQRRRDGRRPGRVGHHRSRRENGNRSQDRGGADEGGHGVTVACWAAFVVCEYRKNCTLCEFTEICPMSASRRVLVDASVGSRSFGTSSGYGEEWSSNCRSCDWLDDALPETVRSADNQIHLHPPSHRRSEDSCLP